MTYKMLSKGSTRGAVTGRHRQWVPGSIIDAPPGEFNHLEKAHYEVIDDTEQATAPPAPEMAVAKPARRTKASRPKKAKKEDDAE